MPVFRWHELNICSGFLWNCRDVAIHVTHVVTHQKYYYLSWLNWSTSQILSMGAWLVKWGPMVIMLTYKKPMQQMQNLIKLLITLVYKNDPLYSFSYVYGMCVLGRNHVKICGEQKYISAWGFQRVPRFASVSIHCYLFMYVKCLLVYGCCYVFFVRFFFFFAAFRASRSSQMTCVKYPWTSPCSKDIFYLMVSHFLCCEAVLIGI